MEIIVHDFKRMIYSFHNYVFSPEFLKNHPIWLKESYQEISNTWQSRFMGLNYCFYKSKIVGA